MVLQKQCLAIALIALGAQHAQSRAAPVDVHSRRISNLELTSAKVGRVVDVDSGLGVSGAKIIVTWNTVSSGIAGYSSTGGTWCDLQRVVTTDDKGNYTIPDVSRDLDLSDRGVHAGTTAFGVASQTIEKNYDIAVFKPGFVRLGDIEIVHQELRFAEKNEISDLSLKKVSAVETRNGKLTIGAIELRKEQLPWRDLWAYYARIPTACSDRMAHDIRSPEISEIQTTMRTEIAPMACQLPATTPIDSVSVGAFIGLSRAGTFDTRIVARIKKLDGKPNADRFDPLEALDTTAGTLCRATKDEDGQL